MEKFKIENLSENKKEKTVVRQSGSNNLESIRENEIESPKFENPEFIFTIHWFEGLIKKLSPSIQNHEYGLIVGDDASGRLPALVLSGLIKKIYEQDKYDLPKTIFVAGGRYVSYPGDERKKEESREKISEYLNELAKTRELAMPSEKTKTLIVTEHTYSGESAFALAEIFHKAGFSDVDVASLSSSNIEEIKSKLEKNGTSGIRFYSGNPEISLYRDGSTAGEEFFHKRSKMSGVVTYRYNKDSDEAVCLRKSRVFSAKSKARSRVVSARRDVKKMIDYLKQIYDREKEKIEK